MNMLEFCSKAGLVKLGIVALDGTKMKANASHAANRTYAGLEKEVKRMLAEAAAKEVLRERRGCANVCESSSRANGKIWA